MERTEVYSVIDSERTYQDSKWNSETTYTGGLHSLEEWFMYIEDYVNEAKHILSRESINDSKTRCTDIMRKVAGMAVCAMEQHGADYRKM